jgi:competence protein ComEC
MQAWLPLVTLGWCIGLAMALVLPALPPADLAPALWVGCALTPLLLVAWNLSARRLPLRLLHAAALGLALGALVPLVRAPAGDPLRAPARGLCLVQGIEGARPASERASFLVRVHACRTADGAWWSPRVRTRIVGAGAGGWIPTAGDLAWGVLEPLPRRQALHPLAWDPARADGLQGIEATCRLPAEQLLYAGHTQSLLRPLDRLRIRMERLVLTRLDEGSRGVVLAMLTGTRGELDPDIRRLFAATGAAHVLAVSGMHLVLLGQAVLGGLTWVLLRVPPVTRTVGARRMAMLCMIPAVVAYVVLTGAPASAVRAGLMMGCLLVAGWLERPSAGLHALCAATVWMTAWEPAWLLDAGFQLSVTATGSLVGHAMVWRARWHPAEGVRLWRWGVAALRWCVDGLRVSWVATLGTAPVLLWHFGELPVLSPFTNLMVVPALAQGSLPLAVLGCALDLAGVPGAAWVWWACERCTRFSLEVARDHASWLGWALVWGRPRGWDLVGWAWLACLSPWCCHRRWQLPLWTVAVALLALQPPPWWRPPDTLRLHAIPVGQGDALLIQWPGGGTWLVDGGGEGRDPTTTGVRHVLPYLRALGIGRVDVLLATHQDADHLGGIIGLLPHLRPREVRVSGLDLHRSLARRLRADAARLDIPIRFLRRHRGDEHPAPGVTVTWMGTDAPLGDNDASLVFRMCLHEVCALMTGDAEAARERLLLRSSHDLRASLLKLGHHGSRTSSTPAFLDRVRPQTVVASLGLANRFGFPHPQTEASLAARRLHLHRTDQGRVPVWETDGGAWWWR